eukprot:6203654-Pleurochrysis_carterae.AAC.1
MDTRTACTLAPRTRSTTSRVYDLRLSWASDSSCRQLTHSPLACFAHAPNRCAHAHGVSSRVRTKYLRLAHRAQVVERLHRTRGGSGAAQLGEDRVWLQRRRPADLESRRYLQLLRRVHPRRRTRPRRLRACRRRRVRRRHHARFRWPGRRRALALLARVLACSPLAEPPPPPSGAPAPPDALTIADAAAFAAAAATRAITFVWRASSRSSLTTRATSAPMSSGGALSRERRRSAASPRRSNSSTKSRLPRSSVSVQSTAHAWRASSARPNDGSRDGTPPPAARCASCSKSPSASMPAAMSAAALSSVVVPHLPTATLP